MLTILAAVCVFGVLVLAHELGHFITAKMTGMRVDEFAIGFGPKIISRKFGETVYSLRIIPLGGFNDIAGMNPEENTAGNRGYCQKSIPARLLVISAGSLMNFILPIFLFFGIFFFHGETVVGTEPIVGSVAAEKPAALAGIAKGDRIIAVDGKAVDTWKGLVENIKSHGNEPITVTYERNGAEDTAVITPYYDEKLQRSLIGITGKTVTKEHGFFDAAALSIEHTAKIMQGMLKELSRILGQPSDADLAGPIGVAQMAGQFAEQGLIPLVTFAAFLSLNLGIINLFPIPALDGGHVVALLVEGVRGKPMSQKTLAITQNIGVALLVLLMIFATKNDIVRIFTGN